jgi:anti-sigma regulatory factor (Ser/Thr protein kinase)
MPLLTCRVTTARALSRPVAPAVLRILRRRLPAVSFDAAAIETVLHEAVANAAIHGNLGVSATAERSSNAIECLAAAIDTSLQRPALAGRIVTIEATRHDDQLVLTVSDEGSGFATDRVGAPDAARPHGRGIMLMRQLAGSVVFRNGGRTVCLSFPVHEAGSVA